MNKVDLYHANERLLEKERQIKDSSKLSDRNKKLILDYRRSFVSDNIGKLRMIKLLHNVVTIAGWLGKDFDKAKKKDIDDLLVKIDESYDSKWTRQDFRVSIKRFYKWLNGGETYPDIIKFKASVRRSEETLPKELLTEDEIDRLVDAAKNPRDRALITTLYESGVRAGELLRMAIKDMVFDDDGIKIIVSGKTGERPIRLIKACRYLTAWLDSHPMKKDRDASLWVSLQKRPISEKEIGYVPLDMASLNKRLSVLAEAASIKKHIHPHLFRHSRATELAKLGLTERELMAYFGWRDSKTAGIYVHLSMKDLDNAIKRINGIVEEKKELPKFKRCWRCNTPAERESQFCYKCGTPISEKDYEEYKKKADLVDGLLQQVLEHPGVFRPLIRQIANRKGVV